MPEEDVSKSSPAARGRDREFSDIRGEGLVAEGLFGVSGSGVGSVLLERGTDLDTAFRGQTRQVVLAWSRAVTTTAESG